ncbi:MAG TPA: cytochrome P450 [Archangium sp.]|jgi:cytochrome P450|uniref:cytochrome P450 n=1 Tax=Archangium sp. TaxID=1872627 RepID=UPI002EDA8783
MSGALELAPSVTLPPGPSGLPLVGSLFEVTRRGIIPVMLECQAHYGDVFLLKVAGLRLVVVANPEGVERVLRGNRENYVKGSIYDNLRQIAGEGLATVEGPHWRTRRKQLQPLFQTQRTLASVGRLATLVDETLAEWNRDVRDGDEVDLFEALSPLTLRVISELVCGVELTDSRRLIGAFREALELLLVRGSLERTIPLSVPTPGNVRARRAMATLDSIVYAEIDRAMEAGARREDDLLGTLLAAKDDTGQSLTRRELRDELVTMLLAGHETVALTLVWALERLGANPEVLRTLTEEVDRVLPEGRAVDAAALQELQYTRRVVQEVLRVRSPAWIVARTCVADDEVCGFRVPAGATVLMTQHLLHRHPTWWREPERFDPDRFQPEASRGRHEYAYFPFSKGPRMCIGSHLGLVEATVALALMTRRLSFEPVGTEPGFNALNALHPSPPLRMRLRWRR